MSAGARRGARERGQAAGGGRWARPATLRGGGVVAVAEAAGLEALWTGGSGRLLGRLEVAVWDNRSGRDSSGWASSLVSGSRVKWVIQIEFMAFPPPTFSFGSSL